MEQGLSRDANSSSANKDVHCMLWNLQVYYCVQKNLPLLCLQPNKSCPYVPILLIWRSIFRHFRQIVKSNYKFF